MRGNRALDLKTFITIAEKKLHIHTLEDWYNVPKAHLDLVPQSHRIREEYDTTENLVRAAYPDHPWVHEQFFKQQRKVFTPQMFMLRILKTIFKDVQPPVSFQTNVRTGHGLKHKERALEIDVFLPELSLGFEYQDPHHYSDTMQFSVYTLEDNQARDKSKKEQATQQGITLINVPYWWDWDAENLIALIKSKRSDLLTHLHTSALPIPVSPPQDASNAKVTDIPGLGLPMLVLYMTRTPTFEDWWIFEKFDGVRGIWSSTTREMYSRYGVILRVPNVFKDTLPSVWLDGEIWLGRGPATRNQAISLIKSIVPHTWTSAQYVIFDTPHPSLRSKSYSTRYAFLKDLLPSHPHPYTFLVEYVVCHNRDEIENLYFTIRQREGEGIILRDPSAPYISGYSKFLYKHRGYTDAEAQVKQINISADGRKTYVCIVPKLHMEHNAEAYITHHKTEGDEVVGVEGVKEGSVAGVGDSMDMGGRMAGDDGSDEAHMCQDTPSPSPPPTYTSILPPTLPSILSPTLPPILPSTLPSTPPTPPSIPPSASPAGPPTTPQTTPPTISSSTSQVSIHTSSTPSTPISLSLSIPSPSSITPLSTISTSPTSSTPSQSSTTVFYSVEMPTDHSFPPEDNIEVGMFVSFKYIPVGIGPPLNAKIYSIRHDVEGWDQVLHGKTRREHQTVWKPKKKRNNWSDLAVCRTFLDKVAKSLNFDPLVAQNWYTVPAKYIEKMGGVGMLTHRYTTMPNALSNVYPDVLFDVTKFFRISKGYYNSAENRRLFFDAFAASRGFDPLVPSNWFLVSCDDLGAAGSNAPAIAYYNYNIPRALSDLYPHVTFDPWKFKLTPKGFWQDVAGCRRYCEDFAKQNKFDPLIPDNWYPFVESQIEHEGSVFKYYPFPSGLAEFFPEVKFDLQKFSTKRKSSPRKQNKRCNKLG